MSLPAKTTPGSAPAYMQRFRDRYRHLVKRLSEGTGSPYAILSYKGKVWSMRTKGERRTLTNAQGDPLQRLSVVILDASPNISKKLYLKGFVEGADDPPDCQSVDGVTSDPTSPNRQHVTCADCPHNQWGSRITEQGKKAKRCNDNRRLALMAVDDVGVDNPAVGPMLLNVPPASLGSLASYGEQIDNHGLIPQAVVTSISFNPNRAYPELSFRGDGILPEDKIEWVLDQMENNNTVRRIINQLTELEETGAANARKEPSASSASAAAHPQPGPAPEPRSAAPAAPPPPPPPPAATAPSQTAPNGPDRPRGSRAGNKPVVTGAPIALGQQSRPNIRGFNVEPIAAPPSASAVSAEELEATIDDGEDAGAAGDQDAVTITDAAEEGRFDDLWNALNKAAGS